MGCIKIEAHQELDFTADLFGAGAIGYVDKREKPEIHAIDVQDIVSFEEAPLIKVGPKTEQPVDKSVAEKGLRILLIDGSTLVSAEHAYHQFEKTVKVAREPQSIVTTAQSMPLMNLAYVE